MLFLSVVPLLPVGRYSDDWHLVLRLCEPWKNQRKRLVNDVAAASIASLKCQEETYMSGISFSYLERYNYG